MVSSTENRVQPGSATTTPAETSRPAGDPGAPDTTRAPAEGPARRWGRRAGPVLFVLALLLPAPAGMPPAAQRTAAIALLMAVWWMTEAVPLAATALLPLVLFPLLGVLEPAAAAAPYANPVIFLFMGGFILALAMQRWGLHRRIALAVVSAVGGGPRRLVGGFMIATAFISMWISNTATAAMMVPIGLALAELLRTTRDDAEPYPFGIALMLGIAYAATIGGVATLIGTPPNAVFAAAAAEIVGQPIGFVDWMKVGVPVAAVLLPVAWALLVFVFYPPGTLPAGARELLREERRALGRAGRGEVLTMGVFTLMALGWLLREPKTIGTVRIPGLEMIAPGIDDATIAIAGALLLFLLPVETARNRTGRTTFVMDWETAQRLPWGVLLLFGGGLSLARAFEASGLTTAIGHAVGGLSGLSVWLLLGTVVAAFIFLSELASNTAVAAMAMPVLAAAAAGVGQPPLALMAAGALAASTAFMLPVGTPPNAIVFGSGYLTMGRMVRAGFWLNLVSVALVTLVSVLLVSRVFG